MSNNSEKAILLSLCIPTYRRAGLLEEGLCAVLGQWADDLTPLQRGQVEIVISDNASPDETPQVVACVQEAYPGLRLISFRQPENKGADANILNAAGLAAGEYVYLLSDDDILLPGALAEMLRLIGAHPGQAAFCVNTRPFVQDPAEETAPVLPVDSDRVISSPDECLRFLGTRLTFLSHLLFRRDRLTPAAYLPFIGTNILQAHLFVDVLAEGGGMCVTRRVFLATRENNTGGYNFFEVFVSSFGGLMRYARVRGYSEAAIRVVLTRHLTRFLTPFVATFKLQGAYGGLQPDFRDGARRLLAEYGPRPFLVFGLLPLMFAPPRLVRGLRAAVRLVRAQGSAGTTTEARKRLEERLEETR